MIAEFQAQKLSFSIQIEQLKQRIIQLEQQVNDSNLHCERLDTEILTKIQEVDQIQQTFDDYKKDSEK